MEWEKYELERTEDGMGYWFYSEGPRGRIRKVIEFQKMRGLGSNTFNLAFGDFPEGAENLNDRSVSNNQDRLKVLNTVATGVIDFLKMYPRSIVLIRATTLVRARLYQMLISLMWTSVKEEYEVLGKHGEDWTPFRKGLNYIEFIVYKKIM